MDNHRENNDNSEIDNYKINTNSQIDFSYYFPNINLKCLTENQSYQQDDEDGIENDLQNKLTLKRLNKYDGLEKEEIQSNNMLFSSITDNNPCVARYFVIKSLNEDNIHKSIKYKIWCSTPKGNQKLNKAFSESLGVYPIYLFFSVNGSGRFLGVAQMTSNINISSNFNYWSQSHKWKGFFNLLWLYIKDIPNRNFKNFYNKYNENKPVSSSRDTQEIHPNIGDQMLKIFQEFKNGTSILDDFEFYENKQINISQCKYAYNDPLHHKQGFHLYNTDSFFNKSENINKSRENKGDKIITQKKLNILLNPYNRINEI